MLLSFAHLCSNLVGRDADPHAHSIWLHSVERSCDASRQKAIDLISGLEELSMSCSTVTAGVSSLVVTSLMLQIALAASTMTISFLCLKQLSRKS